jgi:hypothetical protein
MKKVLLVCFFSTSRPGGSYRPAPLAKYLPEFGWQPVILTPELAVKPYTDLRIIETRYRDVLSFWKKLLGAGSNEGIRAHLKNQLGVKARRSFIDSLFTFLEAVWSYPDIYRGWKPFALKAAGNFLRNERVDAMISCAPMTSHLIASRLSARFDIPWLADFPDLWSRNHGYGYGTIRHGIDERLELKTLSRAGALVTISEPWAEKLRDLHRGKKVYVITHGFDPAVTSAAPPPLSPKFTITYTGHIYPSHQNPMMLFTAVRELISEGILAPEDMEIRFYGMPFEWLKVEIEKYGLSAIARQYGKVPQAAAWEKQRESQLLLLLGWADLNEKGVYTTKVFEYLGARRPILVVGGGKDVVSELMDRTKAGICAFTHDEIKTALKQLYQEYRKQGHITYYGIDSEIERYSHRQMAKNFAGILDKITRD